MPRGECHSHPKTHQRQDSHRAGPHETGPEEHATNAQNNHNRGRPAQATLEQEQADADADTHAFPVQEPRNEKTNMVFMTMIVSKGLIASNQMGAFPTISNRGHRYVCIFYFYNTNHIKGYPIKSRKKDELLRVYKLAYTYAEQQGIKPKLHKLDNETSKEVENFIKEGTSVIPVAPPNMYCKQSGGTCYPNMESMYEVCTCLTTPRLSYSILVPAMQPI